MTEREKIFGRIREALRTQAPPPGHSETHPHPPRSIERSATARPWLPLVPENFEGRLELFRKNAADLKADFICVDGREELTKVLTGLREAGGWKKVGIHRGELTSEAREALALPVCETDRPYDVTELEACEAGISECDALIAQTGSVLVTNRSAGGRALSVLPPHHVVLARKDQLIADLPEAFALLKQKYAPGYPTFMSLITGPSRTGDIERILVLGAHGPRKLTIIFRMT